MPLRSPKTKELCEFNRNNNERITEMKRLLPQCSNSDRLKAVISAVDGLSFLPVASKNAAELKRREAALDKAVKELCAEINNGGLLFDEKCEAVYLAIAERNAMRYDGVIAPSDEELRINKSYAVVENSASPAIKKDAKAICLRIKGLANTVRSAYSANTKRKSLYIDGELKTLEQCALGASAADLNLAIDRVESAIKAGRTKPKATATNAHSAVIEQGVELLEDLRAQKKSKLQGIQSEIAKCDLALGEANSDMLTAAKRGDNLAINDADQRANEAEICKAEFFATKSFIGRQIAELDLTLTRKKNITALMHDTKLDLRRLAEFFSPKELIDRIENEYSLSTFNQELLELLKEIAPQPLQGKRDTFQAPVSTTQTRAASTQTELTIGAKARLDRLLAVEKTEQELAETRAIIGEQDNSDIETDTQ